MEPTISADQLMNKQKIKIMESVAVRQLKIQRFQIILNTTLITLTYLLFIIAFLLLYKGYVVENINDASASKLAQKKSLFESYLYLIGFIYTIFTVSVSRKGLFLLESRSSLTDDFFKMTQSVLISFLIAIGMLFMLKTSVTYSRVFIVTYAALMLLITFLMHVLKSLLIKQMHKSGKLLKNVLIVGAGKVGTSIGEHIRKNEKFGYRVVGYLDDQKADHDVLGTVDQLEKIIQQFNIHELYITIPSERQVIQNVLGKIKKYDISIRIIPEMYDIAASAIQFKSSDLYPYVEVVKTPLRGVNLFLKRLVDLLLSGIGLILLIPVFVVVSILIKLDSKGPIFFKQRRIGKNGIQFTMYKFRSMVANAEELKERLKDQNEMDGPVFKIKEDPRITKLGKFIRKYSIDELPQLFNVFRGDMSLIGPRPPLVEEVEQYNDYQWRRLDVRPGLSGLWQISGRNHVSFEEWVSLDIYYIENWSMKLDTKILLQTIPVVLFGKGAY
jgi:exopolysaccharide biosynthesis polyprenyl glycosylphosphotransferase